MKLPNGFGSVHKLPGKRRNPWRARKTTGWKLDPDKGTAKQEYITVGYYPSRSAALEALAAYNQDPYDIHHETITFAEVYEKWSEQHFQKIKNTNGYEAAFNTCESIHNMKFQEIKLDHLQTLLDESGKNAPTLKTIKNMFGLMWDYAVVHEIVNQDKRDMIRYLDTAKAGNPNKIDRKPFTKKEINLLWSAKDSEYVNVIPILIYSGCRIGELLELTKENINLDERWFYIGKAKTEAGIREVPIAERIVPLFEYWIRKDCSHLICTPEQEPFLYRNYLDSYWKPIMDSFGFEHLPHDTRHTCISLLTEAGVDQRIIRKIVGHKGQGVTETVYTHLELPIKLEAINKI